MESIKNLCREMAANPNPHIMTFSDIANAAAKGAILGQKVEQPVIGAILGVSLEASKRAVKMTEVLIRDLSSKQQEVKKPSKIKRPRK